jgi:hypothetical protein
MLELLDLELPCKGQMVQLDLELIPVAEVVQGVQEIVQQGVLVSPALSLGLLFFMQVVEAVRLM